MSFPISPLSFMNFGRNSGPREASLGRVTPLMGNPGVYEMHLTEKLDRYGNPYNQHITTTFADGRKPWRLDIG